MATDLAAATQVVSAAATPARPQASVPARRRVPTLDFTQPKRAPAFYGPDSIQWRIHKNPVSLGIGGVCAVLLEFADPRIRTGVWDHSTYPVDPIGRSERTGHAAMVGVYGPRSEAEKLIARITRMHSKVEGVTPDGEPYRALDPVLLNWVAATAGYGFLHAYDRFVRRLTPAEKIGFWTGGEGLGELYGVTESPSSDAEFLDMMRDLAPNFEPHPIIAEFLEIVEKRDVANRGEAFVRRAIARASVAILPDLVRERLGLGPEYDMTRADRITVRLLAVAAERKVDPDSPAAQASVRLGLPADFLWRKPAARAELLTAAGYTDA